MKTTRSHIIVTTTTSNTPACTQAMIKAKLVACIQMSDITSHYSWQGKRVKDTEQLLAMKTRKALLAKVEKTTRQHHTHEIPQIVAYSITAGHAPYLKWIDEVTA